jgi:hypothetical protein
VHTESITLTAARRLRDVEGRIDEIEGKIDELTNDYLRVTVITDGPAPGLADRIRERLPNAIYVRTKSTETTRALPSTPQTQAKPQELFQDFYRRQHGAEPQTDLLQAFNQLYEEAIHAAD